MATGEDYLVRVGPQFYPILNLVHHCGDMNPRLERYVGPPCRLQTLQWNRVFPRLLLRQMGNIDDMPSKQITFPEQIRKSHRRDDA
jgi:hypothetical protein